MYATRAACLQHAKELDRRKFLKDNDVVTSYGEAVDRVSSGFRAAAPARHVDADYATSVVMDAVRRRLAHRVYGTEDDGLSNVLTTLEYLFHRHGAGVYVSFRGKRLRDYMYFRNAAYRNPLAGRLCASGVPTQDDVAAGLKLVRNDPSAWRVVNCLVTGVYRLLVRGKDGSWVPHGEPGYDMPYGVVEHRAFFERLAATYAVPDCDFFLNFNDQLLLREDLCVPFTHVTGGKAVPIPRFQHRRFCPILSPCSRPGYLDLPNVFEDDVLRVLRKYFRPDCANAYTRRLRPVPWEQRRPTAVFRGSKTGCGWTVETNARMKLAHLARGWASRYPGYFDVALTGSDRTVYFKKHMHERCARHHTDARVVQDASRKLTPQQQTAFKYAIYVEGNIVAYRITHMFSTGSVVLYVRGEYVPWFYPLMRHKVNCIVVPRVEDLPAAVDWCRRHDAECGRIAERGRELYDQFFTRRGLFKYVVHLLRAVNANAAQKA